MATIPLTEQEVAEDLIVLKLHNVAFSDEQFVELCADNRELHLEFTAQKELVVMTLPGGKTGRRQSHISYGLEDWAKKNGAGITFSPGTLFQLPNRAKRAPDASWVGLERWQALTAEQQEKIPPLCPDFVVELMSPIDRRPARFRMLQAKMEEYMANGARLGWMIDPFQKKVYISRPGEPVECFDNPSELYGDPVLPGFVFNMAQIWAE